MDELEPWLEWKQRCALGLCSAETQSILQQFAMVRFQAFLRKYAFLTNLAAADPWPMEPRIPWHLFEVHLTAHSSAAGKRYKDWLFARVEHSADAPLDVIQGGASLLIRDVVREYLRQEHSPRRMISLDQPGRGDDESCALEDLLPGGIDPADAAAQREFEDLAGQQAAIFFSDLSQRERVALLAKELGLSLAHPAVQQAAGCGKSMVNSAYREVVLRIGSRLQQDYANDDREAVRLLTLMTLAELKQLAVLEAKSETSSAPLFLLIEGIARQPASDNAAEPDYL